MNSLEQSRTCPVCGEQNPAAARFCMTCGAGLGVAGGEAEYTPPPVQPRRVVVTGLGAITSLAPSVRETWCRILKGETGIKQDPRLDPERFSCTLFGYVDDETIPHRLLEGKVARNTSRFARMALEAAGDALRDAGLVDESFQPTVDLSAGGALLGSCVGGTYDDLIPAFTTLETRGPRWIPPHLMVMFPHNLGAFTIQNRFGMGGPSATVVTACATGAQAIGDAFHAIKYGQAPLMVTGAAESVRHPLFIAGFAAMRAMPTDSNDHPDLASRPFDATRNGFVTGEGTGILILEELGHARARGAKIYAEVLGFGSSNDAYHPIAPRPDGSGAARAIRTALSDGGIDPARVDHINAHAASTPAGDLAEAVAIEAVFGPRAAEIPVTSIKGAVGHCMAAAGAIETVSAVLTLAEQCIPPTRNFRHPDPEIHLDIVHGEPRQASVNVVAKNSFGLGGQNACLILGRAPQPADAES